MPKIVGNTVGVPNPKSDWNQTDATKADYIMNKPDLGIFATKKELEAIKVNGGGTTGGVSQEYVDNGLLPKIEVWQPNTEYKVGNVVLSAVTDTDSNAPYAVIMNCLKAHTSPDVGLPDEAEDFAGYWDYVPICVYAAVYDANGNIIHETYVKQMSGWGLAYIGSATSPATGKDYMWIETLPQDGKGGGYAIIPTYVSELQNDSGFVTSEKVEKHTETEADIFLEHNTMYVCNTLKSLILTCSGEVNDENALFECSLLFGSGETPTVMTYSHTPLIWAGDDCDSDGHFAPAANNTYEVSIKKFGDIVSARVGVI